MNNVTHGCVRVFLLISLGSLVGCDLNLKPGAQSILEAVDNEPTPGIYASMAIDKYDANNRYVGTLGLANQRFANEPPYIALFELNAADADPSVRIASLRGLSMHGDSSHAPILVKALADKDKLVRLEAARGLQRLHNDVAIDPLIIASREPAQQGSAKLLSEPEAEVRVQAASALGQYPQRKVLQALIAALDDSDLSVNRAALVSLRTLTGQDLGLDHTAWLEWLEKSSDPFAAGGMYYYPVFRRTKRFYEFFPFVPPPPNEVTGSPAGMPLN
jgi:HEAT repeats